MTIALTCLLTIPTFSQKEADKKSFSHSHCVGWMFNLGSLWSVGPNDGQLPLNITSGMVIYDQVRFRENWFLVFGVSANALTISNKHLFYNNLDGTLGWTPIPEGQYGHLDAFVFGSPLSVKRIFPNDKLRFSGIEIGYNPGFSPFLNNHRLTLTPNGRLHEYRKFRSAITCIYSINRWDEKGRILSKLGIYSYCYIGKPVRSRQAPVSPVQVVIGAFLGF